MRIGLAGAGRIGASHAETLSGLSEIESLLIADADERRAAGLATALGDRARPIRALESVDELFEADLDGLVVAAATDAHAELVKRAAAAGLPVFCEKPVAPDVAGTLDVIEAVREARIPVQVGFQRRFDAGYAAARDAVVTGRLGWLHTVRSCTLDPAPPPKEFVPVSGGIFRDCVVHDIDSIRFVTGHEVVEAMAVGANRGDEIFRECGDADTAAAVLTLDDGTLALISASRYNGAGYDARLEVLGSKDSVVAGLDERTPLTRAQDGVGAGHVYGSFQERFAGAYAAELRAFTDLVAGRIESPCTPEEALEAFYVAEACERSRREGAAVRIDEVRVGG
ncbi:Gfo/Idh/MocA family oxidoreductase [Actinomadura sp. HBU206391]|uniref:Gfo/Idh/MocA family protein n=1 Tax=Actinomadura sp. HBU206391 TaxID=2731692 RepID=UPI00164F1A30|nr:Gfo/Idh/MocA family oxidoreductase [Actinomadura sp. HBU206391]MBC6461066.1 Gfo/Idh/MocA family oxidoreductase [Actinomadura sp. HBU206391]